MTGNHLPLPSSVDKEQEELGSPAKRLKAASDAFGTNPLPTLEKFTFKVRSLLVWVARHEGLEVARI
jgi:hypothetical protein